MCHPVLYAAVMVIGAHQQQEARMREAALLNEAAVENADNIDAAYMQDLASTWDQEVGLKQQAFQNAEEASNKVLATKVNHAKKQSMWNIATFSGGGGSSFLRGFNDLKREESESLLGIDAHLNARFANLRREGKDITNARRQAYYNARYKIGSLTRDPGLTAQERTTGVFIAGAQGYSMGKTPA